MNNGKIMKTDILSYSIAENIVDRPNSGANGIGVNEEVSFTLNTSAPHCVGTIKENKSIPYNISAYESNSMKSGNPNSGIQEDISTSRTLDTSGGNPACNQGGVMVAQNYAVRRLTPTECERLQGFPDGHTAIPWKGKPASECPDGPRYKALGNSMAVPCMRWIGERINKVNQPC